VLRSTSGVFVGDTERVRPLGRPRDHHPITTLWLSHSDHFGSYAARALAIAACRRHPVRMPRWLWALIIILIILVFIVPNPTGTGSFLGNAVDSLVTFFRSFGNSINV
jgi:hypothetical protein